MIEVRDHDPAWAGQFQHLRATYAAALAAAGVPVTAIEHVGSTAVPGLSAKPVIDCDIVVAEPDVNAASDVLVGLGFEPRGEQGIPGRWAFRAPRHVVPTHTYVVVVGSLALRNHLAVRDLLRRDGVLRDEYAAVKRAAAAVETDSHRYVAAKNAVVQRLLAAAGLGEDERRNIEGEQVLAPRERALRHVGLSARGAPLDRTFRVTLNFQPDREIAGRTVLESLTADGVYRSQFVTGTSNGGLTAHPGGDRWRWEQRIFGHAYDDAPAEERPTYGALDHRRRGVGAAPRFGSAHLRLAGAVLDRTTFCFPDSVFEPIDLATAERFDLFRLTAAFDARRRTDEVEASDGGLLDDYVEAHVHGRVDLATDVEALVLDPCFRGSDTEAQGRALADVFGVALEWHEGRRLAVSELERHPAFRGPHVVDVGRRVAEAGLLDAAVLGRAVLAGREDPQDLKKVWHCVARFGVPVEG